jgi:precorrin-2/cobalt-factor-2 C20-methyltransferase
LDKKLFIVSLGPGDIELITIKALKVLKNCDAVLVPTKSKDNSFQKSLTHKIIKDLQKEFNFIKDIIPVYTPMNFQQKDWQRQVDIITNSLKTYNNIAFVTLGDSAIYSTVYYLLDIIKTQNNNLYQNSEVIPGITSFSSASAKVKKPICIGDIGVKIVPLVGKDVPCSTIYMRPRVGMDTSTIKEKGDIYTFENIDLNDTKIYPNKIKDVEKYMTLFMDFVR